MRYISLVFFLMTTLIFEVPAAHAVPLRFVGHLNSAVNGTIGSGVLTSKAAHA